MCNNSLLDMAAAVFQPAGSLSHDQKVIIQPE